MPNWRRADVPGGTYFFTVVTHRRAPIFRSPLARELLGAAIRECRERWPFDQVAAVLLPEHLHAIWSLPRGDARYSARWAWIKREFTCRWLERSGEERSVTPGRSRDRRRGVWQPKFWEHTLESEDDFQSHFDYIHFNPVKHGHVTCPGDWRWSSFHRYVNRGVYPSDWACGRDGRRPCFKHIEGTVGEPPE